MGSWARSGFKVPKALGPGQPACRMRHHRAQTGLATTSANSIIMRRTVEIATLGRVHMGGHCSPNLRGTCSKHTM